MRIPSRIVIIALVLLIIVGIVIMYIDYIDQKAANQPLFAQTAQGFATSPLLATYNIQTQTAAAWTKTPTVAATITP